MSRRRFVAALALAVLAGCSADAAERPEPALEQAGTFIAVEQGPDAYRVFRVRNSLRFDVLRSYLFLDEFVPGARSLEHARALAQDVSLTWLPSDIVLLQDFVKTRYHIVWYRSLNLDERN